MNKIVQYIKKTLRNISLKHKFSVIITVSVLICVGVTSIFSFYIFGKYNQLLYHNTSHILEMTIVNIEKDLKQIEKITDSIIGDSVIQNQMPIIQTEEMNIMYSESIASINKTLNEYYSDGNIISMAIYTDNLRINCGWNFLDDKHEVIQRAILEAKNAGGKTVWLSSGRSDSSVICARDIRQVKNLSLNSMGVLVVHVDLQDILEKQLVYYQKLNYNPLISIVSEDEVLYSNLGIDLKVKRKSLDNTYSIMKNGKSEYFVTETQNLFLPWKYTMYIPFDSIGGSIKSLRLVMTIVLVIVMIVAFGLSIKIVSQIIKHFDTLVNKMHTFKKGNFTIDCEYDYTNRNDELGFVHRSFDEMVNDIRKLVNDNYVKQLLIKDAHIKSLQQQINPHFLFNILQTVNWMAKANNQTEISVIVESVGKMLRFALDEQNNVVVLEKELENTQNYIVVQKIRYKDRLKTEVDVSESLYNQKIPKMALQAIVENAINHALENMLETCIIKIATEDTGDSFNLIVEDNGPGIQENMLEKLENKTVKPSGLGIGLTNIHKRIQLLFSDEYGLELHNTGHGTRVIIKLPKG
ncbi:sensor histidine kinase [Vallitalea guaymasensis]|uniref:histidine kinase n=1 Tax=Vallitalea guaymasensis TaxID=1185412 RepID=A0A8J8MDT3_9FIRM|nr:sensor histidine kinase [Vallitalea guaymasensis]QUH30815.1 sensor histidine kinase [Vallitalea guaymasensis]